MMTGYEPDMETPTLQETHEVHNQPPPLEDYNLYASDTVLYEVVIRGGADWASDEINAFGQRIGSREVLKWGDLANRYSPELKTHDRFGNRIDEVEFHPAYHDLLRLGVEAEVHALPWNRPQAGAHVARAAKHYMLTQVEAGVLCPLTMAFASVPALQASPELAEEWVPRVTSTSYDPRFRPASEKTGCMIGMAMTEKQGGSDVRANTTRARHLGKHGSGKHGGDLEAYALTGHKWFCSAPMSDGFLTLGHTDAGLTCFFVPRWLDDGSRNRIHIQRLKNKLGNRSNASSEIEYHDTWALRLGEEGRGIPTVLEMVNHTRLDCMIGSAALMRQAVVQALHHTAHRSAFGRLLKDQPLMKNVLADLALESEAATTFMGRLAAVYDEATTDPDQRPLQRILTAIGKYWVCKRGPALVSEALECHGGNGYVEESILPRLYREIPLSSIWEGSGNVMCLDVLRSLRRQPETWDALRRELDLAKGLDERYDRQLEAVDAEITDRRDVESRARRIVERLALAVQAGLLLRHAPGFVAEAFCAARLDGRAGLEYGTLPARLEYDKIIERAMPYPYP